MAKSDQAETVWGQLSGKLDSVLGHVQVIPELQADLKLFRMDVAVLQLDMAAANSTLRQHNTILGEHSGAISKLQGDVAALTLKLG
jgi:hypothetical protein